MTLETSRNVLESALLKAVPPGERLDRTRFSIAAEQDAEVLSRRRDAWIASVGGLEQHRARIAATGASMAEWERSLMNVERVKDAATDWESAARRLFGRLFEAESAGVPPVESFTAIRDIARTDLEALPLKRLRPGSRALEGLLDYLADRLGSALQPVLRFERRTAGGRPIGWADRLRRAPVLTFLFGRLYADWLIGAAEILKRTDADHDLIRDRFIGTEPGRLVGIDACLGDPHAGGRSVAALTFEAGKVVYKPKDLRVMGTVRACAGILADAIGNALDLPDQATMDGYAWQACIEPRPLSKTEDPDRFWRNLGSWLCFLQIIGATDFWFDNLLAVGEQPIFIDFETALQPALFPMSASVTEPLTAYQTMNIAPLHTGILPLQMPVREGEDPAELGCVAAPGRHRAAMSVSSLEKAGAFNVVEWEENRHAPQLADGSYADIDDHVDAFLDGYRVVLDAVSDDGVCKHLAQALKHTGNAPVRVIRFDTWSCYRMLERSVLPRALSDGVWREIEIVTALAKRGGLDDSLGEAACCDLRRMDIPLFQCAADDVRLTGSQGEVSDHRFPLSPAANAHTRLKAIRGQPCDEQVLLVRSAIAARKPVDGRPQPDSPCRRQAAPGASTDQILSHAHTLCRRIAGLALDDELGFPTWIGFVRNPFTGVTGILPLGVDFLNGRTGVALALAETASATGNSHALEIAADAVAGAAHELLADASLLIRHIGVGAGTGAGGLVYALVRICELSDRAELPSLANSITDAVEKSSAWRDHGMDYVSGLTGLVATLATSAAQTQAMQSLLNTTRDALDHGPGTVRLYAPCATAELARLPSRSYGLRMCGIECESTGEPTLGNALANGGSPHPVREVNTLDRLWLALAADDQSHAKALCYDLIETFNSTEMWLPECRVDDQYNLSAVSGLASLALAFSAFGGTGNANALSSRIPGIRPDNISCQ